ncbi:hypothetical protein JM84_2148 [Dokdonia sp. Hel_I_63]|nr:hypothetical protein Krodi_2538 [Dokdonia sp. 4H-3-7-5]TVZ23230.1 hypothetical protein JM84_2148 [Dokdonia sp. Hel_I_63]
MIGTVKKRRIKGKIHKYGKNHKFKAKIYECSYTTLDILLSIADFYTPNHQYS